MKTLLFLFSFFIFSGTVYSQTIKLDLSGNEKKHIFIVQKNGLNLRLDSKGRLQNKDVSTFDGMGDKPLKHDVNGRLSDIDGLVIDYDIHNRVRQIGDDRVDYDINGRIRQIGDKRIDYDISGQIRKVDDLGDNLLLLYKTIQSFNNKNAH
ncbi:hypothetical protein [Pedobacter gandavensis]|uniref:hypothetical protein n=1 Tax=Pedobacter gandavensis TaxID=2679963 RepID=UPI00292F367B|nr:hypothetical protein [Pedobacter gandavensis]